MHTFVSLNVGTRERIARGVIAAVLIVAVHLASMLPAWIALIAAYAALTAIIRWDPFYAIYDVIMDHERRIETVPMSGRLAH